jgi:ribosomal small subunit protein bTHX
LLSNQQLTKNKNMGRGDKKTAKGKRFKGSFGVSRPHKVASKGAKTAAAKVAAPKATAAKTEKATAAKTEKATAPKAAAVKTEKATKAKA